MTADPSRVRLLVQLRHQIGTAKPEEVAPLDLSFRAALGGSRPIVVELEPGDVIELDAEHADRLVADGLAELP